MNFSNHVTYLKKKLISRLKMLGKLRPSVGGEVSLQLHMSLILPVIDYGDVIYNCLSVKDSKRLQTIQNCTLRIVKKADRMTPNAGLHRATNSYLTDRRHYHVCNQMYKIVNGLAPPVIENKFFLVNQNRSTRAAARQDLTIPDIRLDLSRRNFTYRGPFQWNLVDVEIRGKPSIHSFKRNLLKSDHFAPVSG